MNRSRAALLSLAIGLGVVGIATPVAAQHADASTIAVEPQPMVAAGTSAVVVSRYIWRGFDLGDRVSVQPALWLRVGELTMTSSLSAATR